MLPLYDTLQMHNLIEGHAPLGLHHAMGVLSLCAFSAQGNLNAHGVVGAVLREVLNFALIPQSMQDAIGILHPLRRVGKADTRRQLVGTDAPVSVDQSNDPLIPGLLEANAFLERTPPYCPSNPLYRQKSRIPSWGNLVAVRDSLFLKVADSEPTNE